MNYAIIGKGFIYSRHKESIESIGGKIVMDCDIDESKHPTFFSYKEMFKSKKFKEEVDAVVIATPNHLHKQMIKDALATDKLVLCEKPLILDNNFKGLEGVKTVLQLRYHSMLSELKKALTGSNNSIDLVMKVCRDEKWWNSWRGDEKKSGGILMGLAIHMFDLLIFLLGNDYVVINAKNFRKKCTGIIKFPKAIVNYHVEVMDNKEGQTRSLLINGKNYELCNKDNLSFSGYHNIVHKEFAKGNGIPLSEAKKSIELVLKLKNF